MCDGIRTKNVVFLTECLKLDLTMEKWMMVVVRETWMGFEMLEIEMGTLQKEEWWVKLVFGKDVCLVPDWWGNDLGAWWEC